MFPKRENNEFNHIIIQGDEFPQYFDPDGQISEYLFPIEFKNIERFELIYDDYLAAYQKNHKYFLFDFKNKNFICSISIKQKVDYIPGFGVIVTSRDQRGVNSYTFYPFESEGNKALIIDEKKDFRNFWKKTKIVNFSIIDEGETTNLFLLNKSLILVYIDGIHIYRFEVIIISTESIDYGSIKSFDNFFTLKTWPSGNSEVKYQSYIRLGEADQPFERFHLPFFKNIKKVYQGPYGVIFLQRINSTHVFAKDINSNEGKYEEIKDLRNSISVEGIEGDDDSEDYGIISDDSSGVFKLDLEKWFIKYYDGFLCLEIRNNENRKDYVCSYKTETKYDNVLKRWKPVENSNFLNIFNNFRSNRISAEDMDMTQYYEDHMFILYSKNIKVLCTDQGKLVNILDQNQIDIYQKQEIGSKIPLFQYQNIKTKKKSFSCLEFDFKEYRILSLHQLSFYSVKQKNNTTKIFLEFERDTVNKMYKNRLITKIDINSYLSDKNDYVMIEDTKMRNIQRNDNIPDCFKNYEQKSYHPNVLIFNHKTKGKGVKIYKKSNKNGFFFKVYDCNVLTGNIEDNKYDQYCQIFFDTDYNSKNSKVKPIMFNTCSKNIYPLQSSIIDCEANDNADLEIFESRCVGYQSINDKFKKFQVQNREEYSLLFVDYYIQEEFPLILENSYRYFNCLPNSVFEFLKGELRETKLVLKPKRMIINKTSSGVIMMRPGSSSRIDIVGYANWKLKRADIDDKIELNSKISCFSYSDSTKSIIIGTESGKLIWLNKNLKAYKCIKIDEYTITHIIQISKTHLYVADQNFNIYFISIDEMSANKIFTVPRKLDRKYDNDYKEDKISSIAYDKKRQKIYIGMESGYLYVESNNILDKVYSSKHAIKQIEYSYKFDHVLAIVGDELISINPDIPENNKATVKFVLKDEDGLIKYQFIEKSGFLVMASSKLIRVFEKLNK